MKKKQNNRQAIYAKPIKYLENKTKKYTNIYATA